MNYWILKTEPSDYSYDDLVRDKQTVWDGVANNAALINIRNAKKGDIGLIYHTGDERKIIGAAKITSDPYPDPKLGDPKMAVFDVKPLKKFVKPITLEEIKSNSKYAGFALVKQGRLSVVAVPEEFVKDYLSEL
ncbi:MAG: EVE domain-containing protein [Ignavibacteria bacterium]|nr:EVE domain-containing protein [Ignavibacteria bacterium]